MAKYKEINLGILVNIQTGKLDANAAVADGEYPFFTCSVRPLKIDYHSFDCECVLVAGNGDLNVKYYKGKFNAYQRTYILESLDRNILNIKFLYYFVDKNIAYLRKRAIGGIIKYIKLENLTSLKIPCFSVEKQKKIVAILDKVNDLINFQKKRLEELDHLAQSVFYEMFGDPVENVMNWNMGQLKKMTLKIGSGATPKGGNESYKLTGIPLIRSLNVYNGVFQYKNLAFIDDRQAMALNNVIVNKDDVLLNITGASVARSCIVPDHLIPARVNQHVAIIRVQNEYLNSIYLCSLLTSSSYQKKLLNLSKSNGATREALTKSDLENLTIPLPPLPLQNRFAAIVEKMEQQKTLVKKALQESEDLFQRLMQDLFRPDQENRM